MQAGQEKLKGLFVIKADRLFDLSHPLWETMQAYRSVLEETHVLVFSRAPVPKHLVQMELEQNFFIYQCSSRHLLIHFWQTWKLLAFQLYWRKAFRADFILSFTPGRGGLFGYILSHRFKRHFFTVASLRMAQGKASMKRMIARFLLRRSTMVFVPGAANGHSLSNLLAIPPAQIIPLQPPVDMRTIARTNDHTDYHAAHPQYNFFISSTADTVDALRPLMRVHSIVSLKYPRAALIVLAPRGRSEQLARYIRQTKAYGVFAYEHDDLFLSKISGSNVYLSVNQYDEADTTLLYALGLRVPVVAYRAGTAAELFPDTPYSRFACEPGDANAAAALILDLLEHQATRNDYAVNTDVLFKKFSSVDTYAYVRAMYEYIRQVLQKPKEGVSVEVMMKKEREDELKPKK